MNRTQETRTAAVLWASAFVIAALVILQAGRLPGPSAYAETASARGNYSLLTARSGTGNDLKPNEVLYVLDNRESVLMVYDIEGVQRGIFSRDGGPVENLFRAARR